MSVENILKVYATADKLDVATGLNWYSDAFGIAEDIGSKHDVHPIVVAGVIAALSPRLEWGANVNLAHRFVAAGGLESGYLKLGLRKAQRILDGESDIPTILGGAKTRSFWQNIANRGQSNRVTIDRHAIDIAAGRHQSDLTRGSLTVKQYGAIADEYVEACDIARAPGSMFSAPADLWPAQLQAITWTAWRREWGGVRV